MCKKRPLTETDRIIAKRIRYFRNERGFTQAGLAEQIQVSTQQLQKYESGVNRVMASRLYEISGCLGIPLIEFFEGDLPPDEISSRQMGCCGKLVRGFLRLSSPQQEIILRLIR